MTMVIEEDELLRGGDVLPRELQRWNWGAFFLNWVWGLGNSTPIALLTLLPPLCFVMPFVLGAKGNAWAWRNGRWRGIEQFRRSQRRWAVAGFVIGVPPLLFCLLAAATLSGLLGPVDIDSRYLSAHSGAAEPGAMAQAAFKASPAVIEALGAPLDRYSSTGSQSMVNGSGEAGYTIEAAGPRGSGTAKLKAQANFGEWSITSFTLDSGGRTVDVVPPAPAGARLALAHVEGAGKEGAPADLTIEQGRSIKLVVGYAHGVQGTRVAATLFGPSGRDAVDPSGAQVDAQVDTMAALGTVTATLDGDPAHNRLAYDFHMKDDRPGAYRFDLAVDGQVTKTVPFTIRAAPAAAVPAKPAAEAARPEENAR